MKGARTGKARLSQKGEKKNFNLTQRTTNMVLVNFTLLVFFNLLAAMCVRFL